MGSTLGTVPSVSMNLRALLASWPDDPSLTPSRGLSHRWRLPGGSCDSKEPLRPWLPRWRKLLNRSGYQLEKGSSARGHQKGELWIVVLAGSDDVLARQRSEGRAPCIPGWGH